MDGFFNVGLFFSFQLLPYINGIKHVARVAADADVETNLVRIICPKCLNSGQRHVLLCTG